MRIQGSCHCSNISFEFTWEPDPGSITARACGCSFCTKHGGVWTSNPSSALTVTVREPALISRYSFGTSTAVFHICGRCGLVPVVTSEIDNHLYAVVSVNAFDNVPPSLIQRSSADFDGESTATRLARRKQGWIADVRFIENVA
jgi:hypothetical protein